MAQLTTEPVMIDLAQPIRMPFGAERRVPVQNMVVTPDLGRKQRGGQERHMAAAIGGGGTVQGIHDFHIGTTQVLVAVANGKIYQEATIGGAFTEITQTDLSWDTTALTSTIQMNDELGIWNANGDAAQMWDQVASETVDLAAVNAENAKYAVQYRGVGFAGGVTATPDTLYYSPVGDITATWTAFNVGLKDGLGGISGIIGHPNPNLDLFFVFKPRGIYAIEMPNISDASGWLVKNLTGPDMKLGCPSHHTIKAVPVDGGPDVWFLSNVPAIHSINRLVQTDDAVLSSLSDPYQATLKDLLPARLSKAAAEVDILNQQYCLFASKSNGSQNDYMLTCSYRLMGPVGTNARPVPEIQEHTGIAAASVGKVTISNVERIVTGGYDGFLNRQFGNDFSDFDGDGDEAAIDAKLSIFNFDAGKPQFRKNWQKVRVDLRPERDANLNFTWIVDEGEEFTESIGHIGSLIPLGTFLLDTDRLASKNIVLTSEADLRGTNHGYFMSFTLGKTDTDHGMEVYRLIFDVAEAGR